MIEQLDIVVVRDPDGGTDLHLFIDGEVAGWETSDLIINSVTVDAGAGHLVEEWRATAQWAASTVHPGAREAVLRLFNDPPGVEYIEGWDDDPAGGEVPQT